jgi:hypothetical protein
MGWETDGRYYTRSRRVNGQVVREYVGGGDLGLLAAQLDADHCAKRVAESARFHAEQGILTALGAQLAELNELADLLVRTALVAAGFQQHHRGE